MATLDYWFDYSCPYAYLGSTQVTALAGRTGAHLRWQPMLLGGVFKATGNHSPAEIPAKEKWMQQDLQRWAARYGAAFKRNPHFPINTLTLMRGAVGMQMRGMDFAKYAETIFHAMWAEPCNLGDPQELAAVLRRAGFDADAFQSLVGDPAVKEQLKKDTEEAVARGVFKATGNHSPAEIPAKEKWMQQDLQRWAARYGAAFKRNPNFPINTMTLMRGAAGMQMRGSDFPKYVETIFHAMWAEPRNLGDPQELAAVLRQAGFDADAFQSLVSDPAVKEQLKRNTEEAVARGVFGAPTFFVGEEMFWGQDRLEFVAAALAR